MLLMGSIFLVLLLLGMPIAFTIGISAMAFVFTEEFIPLTIAVQKMISSTQSFPLLAVPFFVLAGVIMVYAGIS